MDQFISSERSLRYGITTLKPEAYGRSFAIDIFKYIFEWEILFKFHII